MLIVGRSARHCRIVSAKMPAPPSASSSRFTLVITTCSSSSDAHVSATRRGSSSSSSVGMPCAIAQYLHARVHTSPRIRNVAVPASQHSPMFGQPASSQTECSRWPRISSFKRR